MSPTETRELMRLARLYGVQTAYYDVDHRRRQASPESLLAILKALGAPVNGYQDVSGAVRERRQADWQRMLEPVALAWDGVPLRLKVSLPARIAETVLTFHLELEDGTRRDFESPAGDCPVVETAEVEGSTYVVREVPLSALPWGYHRLTAEAGERSGQTTVISAPMAAYAAPGRNGKGMWGVFLPLYALHRRGSWGGGDISDMEALATWISGMGGGVVATLPLLAPFLDEIYEPSPYLPASRMLWNEFYLDLNGVPELAACPAARDLMDSLSLREEIGELRRLPRVDYRQQMRLKRRVLEEMCRCLFARPSPRLDDLRQFASRSAVVADYARFRAACEKQKKAWRQWPQPLRDGILNEGDFDEETRRYYLYTQWLITRQMEDFTDRTRSGGLRLYLDLPLGVHPDGYDVWRHRHAFVPGASAGAPPDAVFTRGQYWESPPLHPQRVREHGYRYVVDCLRHHLRCAGILRIDHVLGVHRVFCIPEGMDAARGVYVHYQSEELYAVLALESHRHQAMIVGEDLGTVPPYVRPAMKKHGLHRTYVVQYELATDSRKGLNPVPAGSVASFNTHDMPPFAAFWQGLDIGERRKLGLLDAAGVREEKRKLVDIKKTLLAAVARRAGMHPDQGDIDSVFMAVLSLLAASPARIVLVNLEDFWQEVRSQNTPTTSDTYGNWQRRSRYSLEEITQMPRVIRALQTLNGLRRRI